MTPGTSRHDNDDGLNGEQKGLKVHSWIGKINEEIKSIEWQRQGNRATIWVDPFLSWILRLQNGRPSQVGLYNS